MRVAGGYWVLGRRVSLWMTALRCTRALTLDSLLDLWRVTCFCFSPRLQTLLSLAGGSIRAPRLPSLTTSPVFFLSHSISRVCGLNEKQLVCGVSLRACPCVRVRPCDEMATALIVWHRAAAAFCQKSSSDSPTGMMAHLTNASPRNGPTMPIQLTEERADGGWRRWGWDHIRLVLLQFNQPRFATLVQKSHQGLKSSL